MKVALVVVVVGSVINDRPEAGKIFELLSTASRELLFVCPDIRFQLRTIGAIAN